MKQKNTLSLSTQLVITPQLQQAIRLLKLSSLELRDELQYALESNPMLEAHDLESNTTNNQPNIIEPPHRYHENDFFLQNMPEPLPNLQQFIIQQLNINNLSLKEQTIALNIIDAINEHGFLIHSLEEIQKELLPFKFSIDEIKKVLLIIQQCEPTGVGSRTVQESLSIQINALQDNHKLKEIGKKIIAENFSLVVYKNKKSLMKLYKINEITIQKLFSLIQSLSPRPGRNINQTNHDYIIPDIYVQKEQGEWKVKNHLNALPTLQINKKYIPLIDKNRNDATSFYLKKQLQEANWLLKSLENRHKTLLRVSACIMQHQQDFLNHGEIAMTPLILQQVANELSLHESTISRVTNNKYIFTPKGLYELKYFFSSHVHTKKGGSCSSTAIKAFIKQAIQQESISKPLSDEKISCLLKKEGILISRRTITKYRELIKIPSSTDRKHALHAGLKKCKSISKQLT